MDLPQVYQKNVMEWLIKSFGEKSATSDHGRTTKFLEEAIELVQSLDLEKEFVHRMVDYVYAREKGEPYQEVGCLVICLAGLCESLNLGLNN